MKNSLRRPRICHKGDFGHLLVIAGSKGMGGAGQLAVSAAIGSGAGKTSWATTEEVHRTYGRVAPEAMSLTFKANSAGGLPRASAAKIINRCMQVTAVAAGPGLGRTTEIRDIIRNLLKVSLVPLVLDADALWVLEGNPRLLAGARAPVIITPHEGEFTRLFGKLPKSNLALKRSVAKRIANQYHCVLVLKGSRSWVISPDGECYQNSTGNPGLAKGGSGDVLTGIIGALVAQGFKPWTAACLGVYAHGLAADIAVRAGSQTSLRASDLIQALPAVWSKLEKRRNLIRDFCWSSSVGRAAVL